jgi:hypothetical protein
MLKGRVAVLVLLGSLCATTAHASLILDGIAMGTGAGIGGSNVVLTIQNTPTESGCVGWNGSSDVVGSAACAGGLSPAITGGDEKTGSSQTQTRSVIQTGAQSGTSLLVVLSLSEPAGTLVTVENLSLTLFSPTGTILFNSGNLNGAGVLDSALQGQGDLGFAFGLDGPQAAAINPFLCMDPATPGCGGVGAASNANNRIGLSALLTNTAGGNETFSVADRANVHVETPVQTPEPGTLAMLGSGIMWLTLVARRQSRQR